MIILTASKSCLTASRRELLVEGAVNVNIVQFVFSSDWDGLTKTAVFQAGSYKYSVLLDESNEAPIPWEVLQNPRRTLYAGVYGTNGESLVLPTIWASLGIIQEGANPGQDTQPPTPSVYEQILAEIGNLDDLETTAKDSLVDAVNEVYETGGGEGLPEITPEDEGKLLGVQGGIARWVLSGSGSGNVFSADISNIVVMDRADYDDLPEKSPTTLYLIRG